MKELKGKKGYLQRERKYPGGGGGKYLEAGYKHGGG